MSKNKEIELKLLISRSNVKKVLALDCVAPYIREGSKAERKLVSVYYDTENLDFHQHGIAYRVRDKGDGTFEATVKTAQKSAAGLSERLELNLPLPDKQPLLEGFAELGLEYDLLELANAEVKKLFTVTVERTTYVLDLPGAVVELAIDHGKIAYGRAADKIDEVELELLEGSVGALMQLAAEITAAVPVFVEKRSKYVRGMTLRGFACDDIDAAAGAAKLPNGAAQEAVGAALALAADELLAVQQQLVDGGVTESAIKLLRKALLKLRAYVRMAERVTGGTVDLTLMAKLLEKLDTYRNLASLAQQWQKIVAQCGDDLGRTALEKQVQEEIVPLLEELAGLAGNGKFTTLAFSIQAQVSALPWDAVQDEFYAAVKTTVAEWKEDASEVNLLDAGVLAESCSGKQFTKAGAALKKLRRQKKQKAKISAWKDLLQLLGAKNRGRILHRDIGIMLGYLLSAK